MSHFPSHDLISAYVDDRLSAEQRAEVETLLQSSAEARAELESYRQLRTTLKALPTEPAPADLLPQIMAQAEQESLHGKPVTAGVAAQDEGGFRKRWTIPAVSVVASVALLLFVMLPILNWQAEPENTMSPESATATNGVASDTARNAERDGTRGEERNLAAFGGEDALSLEVEAQEMQRDIKLMDEITIASDDSSDGGMSVFSAYDISRAEVGDVIEAMQYREGGVVVVQLAVIDREQVLNKVHVLLSNLNVPRETPESNDYGARSSDFLAVYAELDEQPLQDFLAQLQQNRDVEHMMLVSTAMPSETLNQFAAEQGYNDLYAMPSRERPAEANESPLTPQRAYKESVVPPKAEETKSKSAEPEPFDKNQKSEPVTDAQPENAFFNRNGAKSDVPPPPPLPQPRPVRRSVAPVMEAEAVPPQLAGRAEVKELNKFHYQQRQLPLRLRESVGRRLIVQQRPAGQPSVSNGDAAGRQISQEELKSLLQSQRQQRERPEAGRKAGFAGGGAVDRPAAPAAELSAPKPAPPKPGPASGTAPIEQSPVDKQKLNERRYRVLFVLTDDPGKAVPPSASEADQSPKN